MARILAALGLVLVGCAYDVGSARPGGPDEPAEQSSATDARESHRTGPRCAPILDEEMNVTGWLCQAPTLIEPDFMLPTVDPIPVEIDRGPNTDH